MDKDKKFSGVREHVVVESSSGTAEDRKKAAEKADEILARRAAGRGRVAVDGEAKEWGVTLPKDVFIPERKRGRVNPETGDVIPDDERKKQLEEKEKRGDKLTDFEEEDLRQLRIKFGDTKIERELRAWREKK